MGRLFMFIEDDFEQWLARGAGKAEAALAEICQLIADDKFDANHLIGMIAGIAGHGPRQGGGQS